MQPRIVKDHIVFTPPLDLNIYEYFPDARHAIVGVESVYAVPLSLDSARLLNNLGIKAPSPIRTQYDWPIRPDWKVGPWQVDTAEFLTLNKRGHCHNAMRCVDAETEFLTPLGWKRFDTYMQGDLVAQWNSQTDQAEFVEPLEYIKTPCTEMIHFKTTKNLDQMLTPQHRVIYFDPKGVVREHTAEYIHQRNLKTKCGWAGRIPVTFKAPDAPGLDLTPEQIRVMVAVIADGSFPNPTTTCIVRVKKDRKKIRLRQLLHAAGICFKERSKDYVSAQGFTVFSFPAPLRQKVFEHDWWAATEQQLALVVDEAQYWDGSTRKADAYDFCTRVKETADFLQYAAVATKRAATLNPRTYVRDGVPEHDYIVHVQAEGRPVSMIGTTSGGEKIVNSKIVGPPTDGFCYCFEVPSSYLILRRNGRVFVTGNTRKTFSTLWAIDYLQRTGVIHKALIVAPISSLELAWADTLFVNFPKKRYVVLHAEASRRKALLQQDKDIYIINHDGVEIVLDELLKRRDIDCVVVDEVHEYFNCQTAKWKALNKFINHRGVDAWVWGLTGTPTPEGRPTDAYGQGKLIRPEALGATTATAFKNQTMQQFGPYRWVPRRYSQETVCKVLSPSIRFTREVVTDMTPTIIERHAELSKQQTHHLNELLRQSVTELDGNIVSAVNAAVLAQKLVQTSCGVMYGAGGEFLEIDFGPRLHVLKELISGNEEKVVVFVPFTGALEAVARELKKDWSVEIVHGSTSPGKRNQIFRDFQEKAHPHVLVTHPQCMAYSLNLCAASLLVHYAPCNSGKIFQQANARIDGDNQKVKQDIALISATATERKFYQALMGKARFQDIVCDILDKK